ncbi:MAG: hypothetical protein LBQ88_07965 [Treponema sp.]|jgi:hypothetical protein|nr:hypothetical protein [Treponema sp.]
MSDLPVREPQRGLTFEDVWAAMMETDRKFQETDRKFQETDRMIKEMAKETDRKIGSLGGRFGELIEHIMAPNIREKFNALGYVFGRTSTDVKFANTDGSTLTEVDVLLENGEVVLAMEVKAKLHLDDVRDHIERMEKLRLYADAHGDRRRFEGAVAGAVIPEGVKLFAIKNGFYVLEQTGDTVKIDVPDDFVPQRW